jgi:hypothetical protein
MITLDNFAWSLFLAVAWIVACQIYPYFFLYPFWIIGGMIPGYFWIKLPAFLCQILGLISGLMFVVLILYLQRRNILKSEELKM